MEDEKFDILCEYDDKIQLYKFNKYLRRIFLYPMSVITGIYTLSGEFSIENKSTKLMLVWLGLILLVEHATDIINFSIWLYSHILTPFGETIISLYRFIIKLVLHPIVSDYEAREYNYQQIIKKQQKELASIDPKKYTWNDLKETDDELVYREEFFNNCLYDEENSTNVLYKKLENIIFLWYSRS